MVKKKAKRKVRAARPRTKRTAGARKPRKTRARKAAAKKPVSAKKPAVKAPEITLEKVGEITHYFPKVKAAAILVLKDSLKIGDEIYIKGHTTDFKEKITSMQLDHAPIEEGRQGQEIGLLVKSKVRAGDSVYRL
jgi:translation elongation factor EF-Tu-like GTPase